MILARVLMARSSGVDTGGAVPVNIKQWNFFSAQDSGSVAKTAT